MGISYSSWIQTNRLIATVKTNTIKMTIQSIEEVEDLTQSGYSYNLTILPIDIESGQVVERFNVPVECNRYEVFWEEVYLFDMPIERIRIEAGSFAAMLSFNIPLQKIEPYVSQEKMIKLILRFPFKQMPDEGIEGGWEYLLETEINIEMIDKMDTTLKTIEEKV